MTLKEFLQQYWKDNKAKVLTALVTLLALLIGLPAVTYNVGQENPDPQAVATALVENPALLELAAARTLPAPKTSTPTKTKTPGGVATLTPTKTKTPVKTLTPVPVTVTQDTEVTPTPVAGEPCPVPENKYHPVMVGVPCMQYHTGANMRDPAIQKLFDDYAYPGFVNEILDAYGEVYQPPFASSPAEITHHFRGFKWAVDINLNCDQFSSTADDFSGLACIVYSANRIHDDGTVEHTLSRYHSAMFIRVVCGKGANGKVIISKATCGVVFNPQLMDFCEHHLSYKQVWNPIPGTDAPTYSFPGNPPDVKNGGCYRTTSPEDRGGAIMGGWWGDPSNQVDLFNYPHDPNRGQTIVWLSNMWQIYAGEFTNWPIEDQKAFAKTIPPAPGGGNYTFQIFNARVFYQVPVPYNGWIDQWGHVKQAGECTAISSTCYPLVIVGNYPTVNGLSQPALLQRRFESGQECVNAPCLTYATPGTEVFPGYDVPPGSQPDH